MSSPNDTNVGVRFTATTGQIKQMFNQLQRLQNKVKQMSKDFTKIKNEMSKVTSRFDTANKRIKRLNNAFSSQKDKQDRVRASLQKLRRTVREYSGSTQQATKRTDKMKGSLAFTGLAFGFVGSIAGFAAQRIRTEFIQTIEEAADVMAEINRIKLFSDIGIQNGVVAADGFNRELERTKSIANEFGIAIGDAATLLKEVEKAATPDIDTEVLGRITAGFKTLENEIDAQQIVSDFSTIAANFPEEELEKIADQAFAFSKATKLSFSSGSKVIGFAAQESKRLNSSIEEILGTLTQIVAAVPGERGTAGRSLRALLRDLTEPEVIEGLKTVGVNLTDMEGRFVGVESALTQISAKYAEFNAENQETANQFLDALGLSRNAASGLLSYANATDEAKQAAKEQFATAQGLFFTAVADQAKQAQSSMNRFNNAILELKIAFVEGLAPALEQINVLIRELTADKEFINAIKEFGSAIGTELVGLLKAVLPIFKDFADILKNNSGLMKLAAKGAIALVIALQALSILAITAGLVFGLQFALIKAAARFPRVAKAVELLRLKFSVLGDAAKGAGRNIAGAFRNLGPQIFAGIGRGLSALARIFVLAGARGGALFSTAFNIISNAFLLTGRFLTGLVTRFSVFFAGLGATSGTAFGAAFVAAVPTALAGLGAAIGGFFAGQEIFKQLEDIFNISEAEQYKNFVEGLSDTIDDLVKSFIALGPVGLIIRTAFGEDAQKLFGDFINSLAEGFNSAVANFQAFGRFIMAHLWIGINQFASQVFDFFKAIDDVINFSEFLETGKKIAEKVWEAIVDFFSGRSIGDLLGALGKKLGIVSETPAAIGPPPPGQPIPTGGGESGGDFFSRFIGSLQDIGKMFGIPEAFAEEMPETLDQFREKTETANEALDELNPSYVANTTNVKGHTSRITNLMDLMLKNMDEITKNTNMLSEFTTRVAEAILTFVKLIVEGKRAAAKLASLHVTEEGEFRIIDPGISEADRERIRRAEKQFSKTRGEQVTLPLPSAGAVTPNQNSVTVTVPLNVVNAQGLSEQQLAEAINRLLNRDLQSILTSIQT